MWPMGPRANPATTKQLIIDVDFPSLVRIDL